MSSLPQRRSARRTYALAPSARRSMVRLEPRSARHTVGPAVTGMERHPRVSGRDARRDACRARSRKRRRALFLRARALPRRHAWRSAADDLAVARIAGATASMHRLGGAPRDASDAFVPGGTLWMGATRGEDAQRFVFDNEKYAHAVDVAPFAIARACVTQGEFAAFVDEGGYTRSELWGSGRTRVARDSATRRPCALAPRRQRRMERAAIRPLASLERERGHGARERVRGRSLVRLGRSSLTLRSGVGKGRSAGPVAYIWCGLGVDCDTLSTLPRVRCRSVRRILGALVRRSPCAARGFMGDASVDSCIRGFGTFIGPIVTTRSPAFVRAAR